MNTSGEAADQVVRMVLEGTEYVVRLSGKGAVQLGALVYSIARQQKKTKGAERLTNMLRNGKALKVYTFDAKDLTKFKEVANQYGVLYCRAVQARACGQRLHPRRCRQGKSRARTGGNGKNGRRRQACRTRTGDTRKKL